MTRTAVPWERLSLLIVVVHPVQFNGIEIRTWDEDAAEYGFVESIEVEKFVYNLNAQTLQDMTDDPEVWAADMSYVALNDLWAIEAQKRVKANA